MKDFNTLQSEYWHSQIQKQRRDPRHPIVRAYVEPKLAHLEKFIKLNKNTKVLEVGAGNGYFSYYLDRLADLTATDYSDVILEHNPVNQKKVMDARHIEFPDRSFDIVFCHALLHHIDKNERAIVVQEMQRVSRGYVVSIEPNRNNPLMALFGLLKKEEHGSLDFSLNYLRRLFTAENMDIICASSFGLLTPNRMPIPQSLLALEAKIFERSLWNGVSNIIIAKR